MTTMTIFKELGMLDPELIAKAAPRENIKSTVVKPWKKYGAIAACFALIIGLGFGIAQFIKNNNSSKTPNSPDIPVYNNAAFTAEDVAKLFLGADRNDAVATNAYTKIYVPDGSFLNIKEITSDEHLTVYQHSTPNTSLNKGELETLLAECLPLLSSSLGVSSPKYTIKEESSPLGESLEMMTEAGNYRIVSMQNTDKTYINLSSLSQLGKITLDGETVQVDQKLSDREIIASLSSIKEKLFNIFGVTFTDAKVVRNYGPDNTCGVQWLYVYFYNKGAHPLNETQEIPVSDYISISFDNFENFAEDIVSERILSNSFVSYVKKRSDLLEEYQTVAMAKTISLKEAENLLYKGFVFGGHSCPLCMAEQDKVAFEGYDLVATEYVFGYDQEGKQSLGMPFYAFYKNIGTSQNGNIIYAKTYVPAIEISGLEEYFEAQKESHSLTWLNEEVIEGVVK